MKALGIAAILLFISVLTNAQENFVTWNENEPLQWNDFSGKADHSSSFEAESFAEVKYSYQFNSPRDFHFNVKASFNRNTSWIKQGYKSDALLKHEQLHFDIAELYARKLKVAFDNYTYSSNYEEEIVQIFSRVKLIYHKTQQLYDEETNHSLIASVQKEWEVLVKEELDNVKKIKYSNWQQPLFVKNK